jgi:3-oxoadipate enol-lactonase
MSEWQIATASSVTSTSPGPGRAGSGFRWSDRCRTHGRRRHGFRSASVPPRGVFRATLVAPQARPQARFRHSDPPARATCCGPPRSRTEQGKRREEAGMDVVQLDDVTLHVKREGPADGPPVVFANSLGTDLRLWDDVVARLPAGLNLLRYDKRGHGLSSAPPAPYSMGALVRDAERVIEALRAARCGLRGSLHRGHDRAGAGGQAARPRARGGPVEHRPQDRHARDVGGPHRDGRDAGPFGHVRRDHGAVVFQALPRKPRRRPWKRMVETTPPQGYAGCSAAIAGTDFYTTTAALRLPCTGHRGGRRRLHPARSGAGDGRADPRRALRPDPRRGAPALRGEARRIRRDPDPVPGRDRPPARGGA